MTTILDGTKLAKKINSETKKEINTFKKNPTLVAIQVGKNKESSLYISHKSAKAKEIGVDFKHLILEQKASEKQLVETITKLNKDKKVDGIMVQLPLPKQIDTKVISQCISPEKDVDAFNPINKGLLDMDVAKLIPPTALGVIELLKEYKIKVKGKYVVIVGTGEISGKPLSKTIS